MVAVFDDLLGDCHGTFAATEDELRLTRQTLMGVVHNYAGLLSTRIFLGVAEAGLYPGTAYYITMWYPREKAQYRQALFFSSASIAGAFSGLLAYAIGVCLWVPF